MAVLLPPAPQQIVVDSQIPSRLGCRVAPSVTSFTASRLNSLLCRLRFPIATLLSPMASSRKVKTLRDLRCFMR